jgi:hypothetical protein
MSAAKQEAIKLIEALPDNCDIEGIHYRLCVVGKPSRDAHDFDTNSQRDSRSA